MSLVPTARNESPGRLTVDALVRRVDLFTLKLFLTAIEEGQLGRAATREHIAASAATKRIQDLEDLAGVKLFERNAKGVIPSHAGQVFAKHIRTVLGTLDDMRRDIATFTDGIRGHVSIAAPGWLIANFLAQAIGEFRRNFPLVDIELREETNPNTLRALASGEVDLAIFSRRIDAEEEGIDSYTWRSDRIIAVVPFDHPLAESSSISLETLLEHDLVGLDPTTTVMTDLRHAARRIGREPRVKYSVKTVDAARSLVNAGLGVALQPACTLVPNQRDRIVPVELEGQWTKRSYCVGKRKGKPLTPAADALIKQLTLPLRLGVPDTSSESVANLQ